MEGIQIGIINNYPVIYNNQTDMLSCKNVTVSAEKVLNTYNSSKDRGIVEGELIMRKKGIGLILGCLQITYPQVKELIIKIKNERNSKKNQ